MTHPRNRSAKLLMALVATTSVLLAAAATAQPVQLLHPTNSMWRYQTDLSEQLAAGDAWVNPGFFDSAWLSGNGLFGNEANYPYPMSTVIAGGLPVAVYYRSHFTWSGNTAGIVLHGTNYVDDGSIIYLNGVEIARFNMPPDANAATPEALAPMANPGGEPVQLRLEIPVGALTNGNPNPLVTGDNMVAVQVHQNSQLSGNDRVFGLALYASPVVPCSFDVTQPTNRSILQGRSTTFSVMADCLPTPSIQWYRNIGQGEVAIPSARSASYTLTNATFADAGMYYAKLANLGGTATTRHAQLMVLVDSQPPAFVAARLDSVSNHITVTFDEPVCADSLTCGSDVTDALSYLVYPESDPLNRLQISHIVLKNASEIVITLEPEFPLQLETRYTIEVIEVIVGDRFGNQMPFGTKITTPPLPSAISVKDSSQPVEVYTFDMHPSRWEFSTFNWPGGANGTGDTVARVDGAALALDASLITNHLPLSVFGTLPNAFGFAQYSTNGRYLVTRPAGVSGNVLLAHLRNESRSIGYHLRIDYTLGVINWVREEVPGHLVYYSFTGTPNSWTRIPELSGDDVAGEKTATVDFDPFPWLPGAELYLLFVDDNGSGSPDTAYIVDNFKVHIPHLDGLVITEPPLSVSTNEGAVVRFSVVALGTPPLTYRWFKGATPLTDGDAISGATTPQLIINGATPSDAGSYSCRVTDASQTTNSPGATLTIIPDLIRPTLTRALGLNRTTVVLAFSKTLGANASETARYTFTDGVMVSSASVSNNVVTLTTSPRPVSTAMLTITGVTDHRASANLINPTPTTVELTTVEVIDAWNSAWSYNTNNLDSAPDWKTTGGSGWRTGNGLFGVETTPATVAALPAPIVTPIPSSVFQGNGYLTVYFRKSINLPPLSAGQTYAMGYYVDDGAVFYLDGVELGRINLAAGPVTFSTLASAAAAEGVALAMPFVATPGFHTLAAELHQDTNPSPDKVFGAQLLVVPTMSPSLSIRASHTNAVLEWIADSSWRLHSSTNPAGLYKEVSGGPFRNFFTPSATPTSQFFRLNYAPQR